MSPEEIRNLYFRRQYLLSPVEIKCPFRHKLIRINPSAYLYTHVDLLVTEIGGAGRKLILLGDLYDYENKAYNNSDILKDLFQLSFPDMVPALSKYCGRFVIISVEADQINIIHDAAASRKIFYIKRPEGVYCSSQPHLIAKVLDLPITDEPSRLSFYTSSKETFERLHNSNVGNTTCYDDVYQVIPNHFFDYNKCVCERYWPHSLREELPAEEVEKRCSKMIKGYMESICNRYAVMMPVTAGKDSRLLLAASRSCKSQVFYYVNKTDRMNDHHHDLVIPDRLLTKLNLKLNIVNPYVSVDPDFERIFFENNPFGYKPYLPIIYNYYLHFSNRINLPGTFSETGLRIFNASGKTLNAQTLATIVGVEKFSFAREYMKKWLKDVMDPCKQYNYNILNLLYWEERMANWGTEIQQNKDIAQEEVMLYNSRLYIDTLLSAPLSVRQKPDFLVIRRMTKRLWPETQFEPYMLNNRLKILSLFKQFGIAKPVMNLYYFLACHVFKHLKSV